MCVGRYIPDATGAVYDVLRDMAQSHASKKKRYDDDEDAEYILLDSLKGSPGDNISTLLKKKWNAVCKSEYVQTLQFKLALYAT